MRRSISGKRLKTCLWFVVGAGIPFLPLAFLAALAPRQVFFNTFEYHFFHRVPEKSAIPINLTTLIALVESSQFLLLITFAWMGLLFLLGRSQWKAERKAEFYLCGYLAAGLGIFLATARFTFAHYFVLLIPFLTILASVGLMATASWLGQGRPAWLVPWVLALYLAAFPHWFWNQYRLVHRPHAVDWSWSYGIHWSHVKEVAKKVNVVTPAGRWILAPESVYFAARRIPPSGLEHPDSHKLRLSPSAAARLHVVSRADLNDWIATGRFATSVLCDLSDDTSWIRKFYAEHAKIAGCDIFWSKSAQ
jgi:hypothetical protein